VCKGLVFHNFFYVNLAMFFTNLVLHFSCISTIRNGINMTKFVIFHKNEFDNPNGAFLLGVLIVLVNILCAVTNMLEAMQQSTVDGVLNKFVAFKVLIQIQDYYLRARTNFNIKKALAEPLVIKTDTNRLKSYTGNKCCFRIIYYIYKFLRAFYTSVYFYFFPLFICFLPAYKIAIMEGSRGD
jgi:hypothetical protein